MMNNPFDVLLNQTTDARDPWRWAKVTRLMPLRVRLDGDVDELAATPENLAGTLSIGQRVWVQFMNRRVLIHGPAAAGYVESWGQRSSSIDKTTSAGGATATILLLALTVTIPATGRYVVTAGATIAPAGNAAGTVSLTDDTVTRSQDYHSQSSTVPVPIWVSFARSYNAGQVVGFGLRVTPSVGSVATDHYNKWATIERLT